MLEVFTQINSLEKSFKFFMYMYLVFSFFISSNFEFYLMDLLVYVEKDQGIKKVKFEKKNEKKYIGFL